jgi:hypothetical protein
MVKRTRGSSSRPGQRSPLQRSARPTPPQPASTPRSVFLTADEEARAAELEAKLLEEERALETAQKRTRERDRRATEREVPARVAAAPLAVRAADEYAYVARDVRRLAVVSGGLLAILFGLWIAFQATGGVI